MGRFICSDSYPSTGQGLLGNNMFAYCNNNPICNKDPEGEAPLPALIGIGIGISILNNTINAVYYEYSDGKSDVTSTSYQNKRPSRWDKIDYAKQETGDEHYFINAWRYYSEYSIHEYGWYATKWADNKDIPIVSEMAYHFKEANVDPYEWDYWAVNVFTVIWGVLGF